ncbi:putative beta-glucosidase a [Diaporthe ampelina]|uniref:Putative beta-glucosidase a n=1 Tax=Diaporthe ampelina TaxID=1214573 RepID=A0A0G2HPW3_9PEZI|nr:putative beta-glucosidase a [Diaporthe ampelina]
MSNKLGRISTKISNALAHPLDPSNPNDYPEVVRNTSGVDLPAPIDNQTAYVNGTGDFYALDAYTPQFASPATGGIADCAANTSDPFFPTCATLSNAQLNG